MKKKKVNFFINGQEINAAVKPEQSLLKFLRKEMGLMGAKNGCSEKGQCGACTVIVNGEARRSCLVKMKNLNGVKVETIEGLAGEGELHPLQWAFIQTGAIQCGFCTPGMIMAARALLNKNPDPDEDKIKTALKYNICRCTGYKKIIKAIKLAGRVIRGEVSRESYSGKGWIGEPAVRTDAISKVKGEPIYTDDMKMEGTLEGKILFSKYPHAEIISINTDKAEASSGVVAVLTAEDIPGDNVFGIITPDQQVLAEKRVRYTGDPVAVVLAETGREAEKARELIEVEYNPLPVLETVEEALTEDETSIHEGGNVLTHVKLKRGNIARGMAESDVIVKDEFKIPKVEHGYLEPDACFAQPSGNGEITVWTAAQSAYSFREEIADNLALDREKVRVILKTTGGAFGGREEPTVQIHAALGAMLTERPVHIALSREEQTKISTKRHGGRVLYKVGVMKNGKLNALQARFELDTGAYASAGEAVAYRGALFCSGPYEIPHVNADSLAIYTNTSPGGAMRGFGSTQPALISEIMIDEIAVKLKIDPFEIRKINGLKPGKQTIAGQVIDTSVGHIPTLEAVEKALQKEKIPESKDGKKIGVGIASAMKNVGLGAGMEDGAAAEIELIENGRFELRIGSVDCGQGSDVTMAQIAARTLNIPYDLINIKAGDTAVTPDGGVTTASRQTFVTGNAVKMACIKLKKILLRFTAEVMDVCLQYLELEDKYVYDIRGDRDFKVSLSEIAEKAEIRKKRLTEKHYYVAPATRPFQDCTDNPEYNIEEYRMHFAYCYSTQAVIVEVDKNTGEVKVLKVIAAHDTGRTINPRGVEGQIEGGIMMGLGYALSEEFVTEGGRVLTDNFRSLGIPAIGRTPVIKTILIDDYHPNGPYGAKGMGELPLNPTAPAIANAIYDATGVRVKKFPVKAESLFRKFKQQN